MREVYRNRLSAAIDKLQKTRQELLAAFMAWVNGKCLEFTSAQEKVASRTHSMPLDEQLAKLVEYDTTEKVAKVTEFDSLTMTLAPPLILHSSMR